MAPVDDPLEREASRVALAIASSSASAMTPSAAATAVGAGQAAPASVAHALADGGRPLASAPARELGRRMGHDFSGVRVHTGALATRSADDLRADAYTVGEHVVFADGRYAPETAPGRQLLSHELAHVVQHAAGRGGERVIHRAPRSRHHDRCPEAHEANPCAAFSGAGDRGLLAAYARPANDEMNLSAGLATLSAVLATREGPVERARLLRVACCRLEPEDATVVRRAFEARSAHAGAVFHELAPDTQCSLLALLADRAARVGSAQAAQRARELDERRRDVQRQEAARVAHDKLAAAQYAERYAQDRRLLAKSGRIGLLDVFMPETTSHYRIDYASQIHDPLLREAALLNERGATVPIARAAMEPVLRPVEAIVYFVSCFSGALRSADFSALSGKMDLEYQIEMPIPFSTGVGVGAAKELGGMVRQVAGMLIHPEVFIEEMVQMIKLLEDPNVAEIFCAIGADLDASASKKAGSWAQESRPMIAYRLGELAGPLLLNTLIAVIAPEIVGLLKATAIGARMFEVFGELGEGLNFIAKWRKQIKGVGRAVETEGRLVERAEEAVADAEGYLAKHPPHAIEGEIPGERFAPLEDGEHAVFEIKDADAPGGIACELHSPPPHLRVPCPKGLGATEAQLAEYRQRKGIDEIPRHASPAPKPERHVVPVDDRLPEGYEQLPDSGPVTAKRAGLNDEEVHHIQTVYGKIGEEGEALLDDVGIGIEDDVNKIPKFAEHGRLRGFERWNPKTGVYDHITRGHHPDYKRWVLKQLEEAVSGPGLNDATRRERMLHVLRRLRVVIKQHPEVLAYGPGISPRLLNMKFRWPK